MSQRSSPVRGHAGAVIASDDAAVAYGVAQSGHGVVPSSTHSHKRMPTIRPRTRAHSFENVPWNTTASTSAFSHSATISSSP